MGSQTGEGEVSNPRELTFPPNVFNVYDIKNTCRGTAMPVRKFPQGTKLEPIGARVPYEVKAKLRRLAEAEGRMITPSDMLRLLIERAPESGSEAQESQKKKRTRKVINGKMTA